MRILKFGGTSVGTPERIGVVADIIKQSLVGGPSLAVVSAFAGVTNALIKASEHAARGEEALPAKTCGEIEERHTAAIRALALEAEHQDLTASVSESVRDLGDLYRGAALVRECSPRTLDAIASYGERLSAPIVAAALRARGVEAEPCDARGLIVTDQRFGAARVVFDETNRRIQEYLVGRAAVQVATGFVASSPSGETTTLGRGGSDYTAAIFGAAIGASVIEIWTDVDGVMSADPRLVREAFPIEALSYDELMELSHFGAKVVYPPTVHPARGRSIPLVIRNTLNPTYAGTRVVEQAAECPMGIRGVSSISRVALMRLEGDGMIGVPGIAARLFGALAHEHISVILISQASSEHSICFAVEPAGVERARDRIRAEFALERQAGLLDDLVVEDDVALIAAVGAGMRERRGVAGQLFGVLGRRGVNIRAIAQGSSELNITLAVDRQDEARALNAIHQAFFQPHRRTASIVIAGLGRVGAALLEQIGAQAAALERDEALRLRVIAVANSKKMLIDPRGMAPGDAAARLDASGSPLDLDRLIGAATSGSALSIFVDCTASDAVAARYNAILRGGAAVVAANKRAFSGPLTSYAELKRTAGGALYYETTVGAGLPVVRVLSDLVRTGDRVVRIDGVLSGTLSFLMGQLMAGAPFSAAVREAHMRGLTEPDPRDDLSGADVGRKLVILAREAGLQLEPGAVVVESLLAAGPGDPQQAEAAWMRRSLDEFWAALPELDPIFEERRRAAAAAGRRLSYLARVSGDLAKVALETVELSHPCASLAGSDNLIAFYTARYHDAPLVVRGPGAGPDVTAAGVFADILRAAAEKRARLEPR